MGIIKRQSGGIWKLILKIRLESFGILTVQESVDTKETWGMSQMSVKMGLNPSLSRAGSNPASDNL